MQVVPAATCWTTDQAPLAHCWKDVPPMQFHMPSVVQAVPAAIAVPEPEVPVLAGVDAELAEVAATGAAELAATDDATGADVA